MIGVYMKIIFFITVVVLQFCTIIFACFGPCYKKNLNQNIPVSSTVRTTNKYMIELYSCCFDCEPYSYMTICIFGFDKIVAFCNNKIYVCAKLPQCLQDQIVYWMNADQRAFQLANDIISPDGRKSDEIVESMSLIPVDKAMTDNAHELIFACGDEMQTPEFHRLIVALKQHIVVKSNLVSSVPVWLEKFYSSTSTNLSPALVGNR